jgi:hypothetical protein
MRDAFFVFTLSASLLAAGCAEHGAPARVAPVVVTDAGPPAHLVLAEATAHSGQPAPPAQNDLPATIDHRSGGMARAYGWFSVAVGTLGLGVAATTGGMMLHQKSQRDADCDAAKVCSQDGFNANSQLAALSGWNAGSFVVAAAGLGLGAFLLLTSTADGDKQTAIGVAPTGSGAGLNLKGSF